MAAPPSSLHASAVIADETGILITGRAGSGKSTLSRAIVAMWHDQGRFARLVGDDRILLSVAHGRLVARPHPVLAGHWEVRGVGIIDIIHEGAARIGLVVCLEDGPVERMPEARDTHVDMLGIKVPLLRIADGIAPQIAAALVRARLQSDAPKP